MTALANWSASVASSPNALVVRRLHDFEPRQTPERESTRFDARLSKAKELLYKTLRANGRGVAPLMRRGGRGARLRYLAGRRAVCMETSKRPYASEQAHSSLIKTRVMLGLGADNIVRIPTDDAFRMKPEALRLAMAQDVERGFKPMAVVATIGTTSCASVDPVPEIAAICRQENAWLHVDATYGGALAVLPESRWVLEGLDGADSIIVNPHKWLFVPLDFSVLDLKTPDIVRALFMETPEYLEGDAQSDSQGLFPDYMDYGIQLGRRFRATQGLDGTTRFWTRRYHGADSRALPLATLFAEWVAASPDFELAAPLSMAVVCFRHTRHGEPMEEGNARYAAIVNAVNATGAAYLTHTSLNGRTCMRIGIGNIDTTEVHVQRLWALVNAEAHHLTAGKTGGVLLKRGPL